MVHVRRSLVITTFVLGLPGCLMTAGPGAPALLGTTLSSGMPTPVTSVPPTTSATVPPVSDGLTKIPYRIGYTAAGQNPAADIANVNSWLGRPIDITAATITMTGWWWGGIPSAYVIDVSFPMLTITGWDSLNATDLGVAATGGYDKYYLGMAQTLAKAGNPVIVRIGWEMNGNWYPWSIGNAEGQHNTAANYIATYKRIVGILRANVPGVKIEFCTNWQKYPYGYADGSNAGTPLDYWPGPAYVDYVSMDIYETNIGDWAITQSGAPYDLDWLITFAKAQNVRVGLPEWGAGHGDVGYLTSAFAWMDSLGPLFAFSVYSSWDPADQFLTPGQSPAQQKAFAAAYGKTKFVEAP